MTRRTRGPGPLPNRQAITTLAFAVLLIAMIPIVAAGQGSRTVIRVGALLFALGSIATYIAAGSRRHAVREVDVDGRDV